MEPYGASLPSTCTCGPPIIRSWWMADWLKARAVRSVVSSGEPGTSDLLGRQTCCYAQPSCDRLIPSFQIFVR
jgi:hypothetical protein